jgi:hypothetical protein
MPDRPYTLCRRVLADDLVDELQLVVAPFSLRLRDA